MVPSRASRPAFLAAVAAPRSRRIATALSTSPFDSSRARLHSIMPAPVRSRRSFTADAVISAICFLQIRLSVVFDLVVGSAPSVGGLGPFLGLGRRRATRRGGSRGVGPRRRRFGLLLGLFAFRGSVDGEQLLLVGLGLE